MRHAHIRTPPTTYFLKKTNESLVVAYYVLCMLTVASALEAWYRDRANLKLRT